MNVNRVFIDFEGLYDKDGKLRVKELAVMNPNGSVQCWMFLEPHDYNQLSEDQKFQNAWLTTNQHGIRWADGDVSFDRLESILSKSVPHGSRDYVKEKEKVALFSEMVS